MINRENYMNKLLDYKDTEFIKVITGIRRCGKSSLLKLFMYKLKEDNPKTNIIYMNFESFEFDKIIDYKDMYNEIKEQIKSEGKTYILLDEVQRVINWEKCVNALTVDFDCDIYITGSNAYLLSSELSTYLSGRYIEIKMLPLSFKEYISAFEDKTDLSRKFRDYLRYSSFPQSIELYKANPENINIYLEGIFNTVVYKDVISRKGIADKNVLESIIKYLFNNIGSSCSIKKISDTLTSMARQTSYNTVANYVEALVDSYILYKANRYDIKGKDYLKTQEKYYIVDIGLRYYLLGKKAGQDMGHILENVIYLELLRRGYKVYIGKLDELEIDFVAQNFEGIEYYQVAFSVRDEKTLERELTPLKKINDNYPKYIITLDDDLEADYDGIKKINAIDWLLS